MVFAFICLLILGVYFVKIDIYEEGVLLSPYLGADKNKIENYNYDLPRCYKYDHLLHLEYHFYIDIHRYYIRIVCYCLG
jgi:hypothetical protein